MEACNRYITTAARLANACIKEMQEMQEKIEARGDAVSTILGFLEFFPFVSVNPLQSGNFVILPPTVKQWPVHRKAALVTVYKLWMLLFANLQIAYGVSGAVAKEEFVKSYSLLLDRMVLVGAVPRYRNAPVKRVLADTKAGDGRRAADVAEAERAWTSFLAEGDGVAVACRANGKQAVTSGNLRLEDLPFRGKGKEAPEQDSEGAARGILRKRDRIPELDQLYEQDAVLERAYEEQGFTWRDLGFFGSWRNYHRTPGAHPKIDVPGCDALIFGDGGRASCDMRRDGTVDAGVAVEVAEAQPTQGGTRAAVDPLPLDGTVQGDNGFTAAIEAEDMGVQPNDERIMTVNGEGSASAVVVGPSLAAGRENADFVINDLRQMWRLRPMGRALSWAGTENLQPPVRAEDKPPAALVSGALLVPGLAAISRPARTSEVRLLWRGRVHLRLGLETATLPTMSAFLRRQHKQVLWSSGAVTLGDECCRKLRIG
eukprot:g18676.t1